MQLTIALLIASAIPIFCLGIIYTRNLYSTSQIGIVILCFGWGMIGFYIAAEINTFILTQTRVEIQTLTSYVTPLTEEIVKAALLIYLVRRRSFHYFVDGAIYGFAIGIGFAVVENYRYVTTYEAIALSLAIGRTLSTNLIHATASAIIGVMLGLGRFQRNTLRHALYFLIGLVIAALIHSGFNIMVSRISGERWLIYTYAITVGISGAGFILYLIQRGLKEERRWIEEMLGIADRVTQGESRMVLRLAEASVLLTPIVERFGKQKAILISRLLVVQAQMGILGKTSQILLDGKMQRDAIAQISELHEEMDSLRARIGTYPMLYLRSIFPSDNTSVWTRLEAAAAVKRVEGESETENKEFSLSDMLHELPLHQRQIMQAILRGRKQVAAHDLQNELTRASREHPLTESEFIESFQDLILKRKITRVDGATDLYQANIRRKAGLVLTDNVWERLSLLSYDTSASNTNVWNDLKTLLEEQSKTQKDQKSNLWVTLAQRIPD